jgi:acetyl-CoA acyltransferase
MALENDREFQKRYMFAAEVKLSRKKSVLVEEDEGIMPTTAEGLANLKPLVPGGVLSFGAQTHPADGNASIIVTTEEKARELSSDPCHAHSSSFLWICSREKTRLHGRCPCTGCPYGP